MLFITFTFIVSWSKLKCMVIAQKDYMVEKLLIFAMVTGAFRFDVGQITCLTKSNTQKSRKYPISGMDIIFVCVCLCVVY